jgi:glutamyl-tRNA synthetase/nondiscriminating glutamyl-tRNA synthetase
MHMKIVTRFAPSPTGLLHAGNYRTALFTYLFARHQAGTFLLRVEDTDKARSKKEYEDNIIESLEWLGLENDGFFRQSDRIDIHKKYLQQLIDSGHAYASKETPKNPGDREEVIRFKNPNKKVRFNDLIRGTIEFDTTDLHDFVIARSMDEPIFHLVVVVDDHEMGVTHVIRGEDHISNTPRQILICEALGLTPPLYAHIPLLLAPDRSKLSKRKGALPMTDYRDRGYLKEALLNYMALLGWNPAVKDSAGAEREIFSKEELIGLFDLSKVQKGAAIFNEEKLAWMNKIYLAKLSDEEFLKQAKNFMPAELDVTKKATLASKLLPLIREKIQAFGEIKSLFTPEGELSFVAPFPSNTSRDRLPYKKEALMWRQEKEITQTKKHLKYVIDMLTVMPDSSADFTADKIKAAIWPYADKTGKGNVLWPMRYALSGKEKSPDPFIIADILGKAESLGRLTVAYESI